MAKDLYSRNFVKDLLMIEILKDTDSENPKTAKQIFDEIERLWRENENLKNISFYSEDEKSRLKSEKAPATITRHIHDLNKSGLYDIRTCDEKNRDIIMRRSEKNFILLRRNLRLLQWHFTERLQFLQKKLNKF